MPHSSRVGALALVALAATPLLLLPATSAEAHDGRLHELMHRAHAATFSKTPPPTPSGFDVAAAKTFNVVARSFQFDFTPSPFVVNEGDSVTLNLSVLGSDPAAEHGFLLERYLEAGISIRRNAPVTVDFIANVPGTFIFLCHITCGLGHPDMNGTLVVNALPPLTISGFTPASGPAAGGTEVTINGSEFMSGATVKFGDTAAASTNVQSATRILAISPARPPGAVMITVTNPDGRSATSSSPFTYDVLPAPSIVSFGPAVGPTSGGTAVAIEGANFQSGATVKFGDIAATSNVNSSAFITTVSPAHSAGMVAITVTNPDGRSATSPSLFTYQPATVLSITSFAPATGPPTGGTVVVIEGANFQSGATVKFGAHAATATTVNSATRITATSPAQAAGAVVITVTNPDGQIATATSSFTYRAAPARRRAVKR